MKFRFYINDTVMFESDGGDLTVSKEVLDIGGFGGNQLDTVSFSIRENVAELRFCWGGELSQEELRFMREGRFIETIKSIRQRKGLGLKEAKEAAEKWRDAHPNEFGSKNRTAP